MRSSERVIGPNDYIDFLSLPTRERKLCTASCPGAKVAKSQHGYFSTKIEGPRTLVMRSSERPFSPKDNTGLFVVIDRTVNIPDSQYP